MGAMEEIESGRLPILEEEKPFSAKKIQFNKRNKKGKAIKDF